MARIGRIAFLGTGSFAVPLLAGLPGIVDDLLVISAPDRPAGRHLHPRAAPVAARARELGLAVVTPGRIRSEEGRAALAAFRPDGLLLAAYGQLVPPALLALGDRPPLNAHPSLLPRHRGADPVAGAILAGDEETGVTLMIMTAELDAGPIVDQWRVPLGGREQAPELEDRLAKLAAEVVPPILGRWRDGLQGVPQDAEQATLVHPFRRADGWIDWTRDADAIDRLVRALQPWPGAWTTLDGRRIHVRRAHPARRAGDEPAGTLVAGSPPLVVCGTGALALELVQPEGRQPIPAADWARGLRGGPPVLGGAMP